MDVKQLTANPENPRTISKQKLAMLKKSLEEFGDLGAIVFNQKTKRLVGGHQRIASIPATSKIVVEKQYAKTTKTGTAVEGFIEIAGERHKYREVKWDEVKEKAANIAANKGAGEWEMPKLGEWMKELDEFGFDLDLTLFNEDERRLLLHDGSSFKPGQENEQGQLDQKDPLIVRCPGCKKEFNDVDHFRHEWHHDAFDHHATKN